MQNKTDNQKLPIKTRIAAWWTLIVSGLLTGLWLFLTFGSPLCLPPLFLFISIIFFLKTKKRNWWYVVVISLGFITISGIFILPPSGGAVPYVNLFPFILHTLLFLIPLIFLLLDRKNFFKIAS